MGEQLRASPQPTRRRLARSLYCRSLAASFRLIKLPLSAALNSVAPKAPWTTFSATWQTLDEYAAWLPAHTRWRADRLGGLVDRFPDLKTIAAQFRDKGLFEEDCDGLALFSAQNVRQFADDLDASYVVTVILDPFTFTSNSLQYAAHVLCVFRHQGAWRVVSNTAVLAESFASFAQAVQTNAYCAGHPLLWLEVRDFRLHRLASGSDLDAIGLVMDARYAASVRR